jgi:epoxyqueuosine reductase
MTGLSSAAIKARAREVGFDLCGVSRAVRHPKLARLEAWIAAGRAGDMTYLSDSIGERADPREVLATATSVVSLACVYNTGEPYSTSVTDPSRGAIARYAWGDDYHLVVRARLRELVSWMADEAGPGLEAFSCVDDGPIQERVFAEQAGLGWIGKNTCVINARLGSWIFLAEVLTNAELEWDEPAVDQCGTCTRCIEACPTGALVAPYELDATRCLSYLTVERRGPVDAVWRPALYPQIFGCDTCQDVCPWNRRAAVSDDPAWAPRPGLASPSLVELCVLSDEAWRQLLSGSALRRAGLRRIRRSLACAAAHLPPGDAEAALSALAAHDSGADAEVTDAVRWARLEVAKSGVARRPGVS